MADRRRATGRSDRAGSRSERAGGNRSGGSPARSSGVSRTRVLALAMIATAAVLVLAGAVLSGTGSGRKGVAAPPSGTGSAAKEAAATPSPAATAVPAPTVDGARLRFVREDSTELSGRVPDAIVGARGYALRLFVNGRLAKTRKVGDTARFRFRDIPLENGRAQLAVSLKGPRGESRPSPSVLVFRDQRPPQVTIEQPADGEIVSAAQVVVGGATQGRSTVMVENQKASATASVTAGRDGRFQVPIALAKGTNVLRLVVTDPAGNESRTRLTVERGRGQLKAKLRISKETIPLSSLPESVDLTADVADANGQPVEGAKVTFSISPPGVPAATYGAVTVHGRAKWAGIRIPRDGVIAGKGFATVRVVLPDRSTVIASVPFELVESRASG